MEPTKPLRIGVMGCSEFAGRAMIPAIRDVPGLQLVAVASRARDKAELYSRRFSCEPVEGYDALLGRSDIDCIYMPLPTGLHPEWAAGALEAGKHILIEKSFASDLESARKLVAIARRKKRLVVENFLFPHHSQYAWVSERLAGGNLGTVHLFRSNFSFPRLKPDNFRYNAALGGGALLDAGAYMVKAARLFLGEGLQVVAATRQEDLQFGVDMSGTATFINPKGQVAQVAFGFDSLYQCNWEFIGNQGKLTVERAYTPPPGFAPVVRLERQNHREEFTLLADNHYVNMWRFFARTVLEPEAFASHWAELEQQAFYLEQIRLKSKLA